MADSFRCETAIQLDTVGSGYAEHGIDTVVCQQLDKGLAGGDRFHGCMCKEWKLPNRSRIAEPDLRPTLVESFGNLGYAELCISISRLPTDKMENSIRLI